LFINYFISAYYSYFSETQNPSVNILHARLAELRGLQNALPIHPYSVVLRLKLANSYRILGYPDLAVGDAYKALLLIDEVVEELEYHDLAFKAAKGDIALIQQKLDSPGRNLRVDDSDHDSCCCSDIVECNQDRAVQDEEVVVWAKSCWSKTAYEKILFLSF